MRKLVQLRPISLNATERRLGSCYDVSDLRRAAKRRIPRPVFDYVDGAADEEISYGGNGAAFRAWRFLPRALAGVGTLDTAAPVLGAPLPVPMALGPAGYTRMMHPDGEIGAARAGVRHGLPYTLSTMAATGIEELRAGVGAAPPGSLWFQLYVTKDRARARDLVRRAADNGFGALVVTVDTVVTGNRLRDLRNGLTIPPSLTLGTVASVAAKPGYWWRLLTGPALDYANFSGGPRTTIMKTGELFDPDVTWSDIENVRSWWPGKLLIKGPLGPADARRAVELGADGIQLSNHGGRQLDRAVAPADMITPVREAIGPSVTLLVDSGIRHGADVVVALALGADAAVLGRAYLYGLMAGGTAGVDRAIDLLTSQLRSTMQLLGVTSAGEVRKRGRELITREP